MTNITYPSVNGVTQQNTFYYNYATGNLVSSKDANNQSTGYLYADSLNRLTETDYPDGGKTTIAYNDAVPSVTASQLVSTSPSTVWKTTMRTMDGMWRTVNTQTSDPISPVNVTTTYDGFGNVMSVSNPYRSSPAPNDPPYGMTGFTYDALGRKLRQCQPDNGNNTPCQAGTSYLQWSYNGNSVTSTDEAGHSWQRTTDALGRLTNVIEPGGIPTSYIYSALDNLTNVTQTGVSGETPRTRNFTYNSLSRLITATNPETGTICYGIWSGSACQNGYDPNGNVVAKTDARGISLNYSYDALNRSTAETSSGSIIRSYSYDNTTSGSYGIGKLFGAFDGSMVGSGYYYDRMGRISGQSYSTPGSNGWQQALNVAYDVAGDITSLTYPDGRTLTQSWDSATHLSSIAYTGYNYLASASYFPSGSPQTMTFGNGDTETYTLNNRLQPVEISLQGGASNSNQKYSDKQYCYGPSTASPACPSLGVGKNNGNIWQITDTLKSANTQGFTYDGLNRISSFSRGGVASQNFTTDSFGNMSPMAGTNPIYTFDPATNHINNLPCAAQTAPFNASGDQICDTDPNGATRQYAIDAENRIKQIAVFGSSTPFETYTYGDGGNRVRKDNADGTFTEYVYFNGQPVAEHSSSGTWTDYVYANGRKIATAYATDTRFHLTGVNGATTDSGRWTVGILPIPANVTIQTGDVLNFRMYQHNATPGISMGFTDNSNSDWYCGACKYPSIPADQWTSQSILLSGPMAGKTLSYFFLGNFAGSPDGEFDVMIADLSIAHTDGTVTQFPIPLGSFSWGGDTTAVTNGSFVGEQVGATSGQIGAIASVRYYLNDHLGTTQMEFSQGGWPVWKGEFSPFGQELDTQATANHYKFTGKERDTESGLDYFGARYYGSNMGRFMSPDWSDETDPVPYADLSNPQSLNLYSYVGNNPLIHIDADGHCWPQWLCNLAIEVKNKVLHGEFTTNTSEAKIHQLVREDARNREMRQYEEQMKTHPPEIQYGVVFTPFTMQFLGQMGRPAFIPKNWNVIDPGRGRREGLKFQDPNNTHNNVRIMKGDPNSSNPGQQKDYMVVRKNGATLDANGNPTNDPVDYHIPVGRELPPDIFGPLP